MDELIAFVTARLDEEEASAKAAAQFGAESSFSGHPQWINQYGMVVDATDADWAIVDLSGTAVSGDPVYAHIARHDPDRVLREVAAKRALLAMHAPVPFWGNNPPPLRDRTPENAVSSYCECQCPDGVIEGVYPCDTARLLAAVWSDHADYRPEWAP